jgi:hypothetical protein
MEDVSMHTNSRTPARRSIARPLLLLPALVVGLSLAVAGGASAQAGFQATVKDHRPKPKPCANGDFICGSATTNYGDATWTFNPTTETPPPPGASCGSYTATVTFALGDASSSTLVLDENGTVCGPPGNSLFAPGQQHSYGNPFYLTGSWIVETATGTFGSIAVGSGGTDTVHLAGSHASGTYVTP